MTDRSDTPDALPLLGAAAHVDPLVLLDDNEGKELRRRIAERLHEVERDEVRR